MSVRERNLRLRNTLGKSDSVKKIIYSDNYGVLYIAYGQKAVNLTENAIETLRLYNNTLSVTVISDQDVKGANSIIYHEDTDAGARSIKTSIYLLTPYDKTLYMDADTEVLCDPEPYFRLLDDVDLVIGQDTTRIFNRADHPHLIKEEVVATIEETSGGEFIQYNTGVMLFNKCDNIEKLMNAWHEEWQRWGKHDQPAMFRAMYRHPVRIAPMREAFNVHHSAKAKVVFHAHRRASREGAPK